MEKKIFKGFYHIWAWRPSWSTDRDHFSNLSFPHPKEAPYEIWAKLAQRLQRRSRLKMLTDGRTHGRTDGRRTKSDHNSSSWAELRWAKNGPLPLWKRVYSKGKDFASLGSKFFPFRVDPFQKGLVCRKAKGIPKRCLPLLKWPEIYQVQVPLIMLMLYFSDCLYKTISCVYSLESPRQVEAIQMSKYSLCFYKELDKLNYMIVNLNSRT